MVIRAFIASVLFAFVSAYCALRRRNRWREDQKILSTATPTPTPHKRKNRRQQKESAAPSPSASAKRIRFSIAECHPVGETKKKSSPTPEPSETPSPTEMPLLHRLQPQRRKKTKRGAPNATLLPEAISGFENYPPKCSDCSLRRLN